VQVGLSHEQDIDRIAEHEPQFTEEKTKKIILNS
jgi:hypothetical protein